METVIIVILALAAVGFAVVAIRAREQTARLRAQLEESQRKTENEKRVFEESLEKMEDRFKGLASDILKSESDSFMKLASERFDKKSLEASNILEQKTLTFQKLVEPIEKTLTKVQVDLGEFERRRGHQYGELSEKLKQVVISSEGLQKEAQTLSQALRRPEVRGSWGEMQLRRVVELAGMANHCDFEEQVHLDGDDGRSRPDLVVYLPNDRLVIVDSKAVMNTYLEALETDDQGRREQLILKHAQNIRIRIDELSRKAYWEKLTNKTERSIDFVVLFIPNEVFLQVAVEVDPGLIEDAMKKKVLIAGPVNLVALLKAISLGWQENQLTENAQKVIGAARDLYDRLKPWMDHLARMGNGLKGAMKAYDDAMGSLERRVLPAARKMRELGLKDSNDLEVPSKLLGEKPVVEDVIEEVINEPTEKTLLESLEGVEIEAGPGEIEEAVSTPVKKTKKKRKRKAKKSTEVELSVSVTEAPLPEPQTDGAEKEI